MSAADPEAWLAAVGVAALAAVLLSNAHRRGLVAGLKRYGPVEVTLLRTIRGEWAGASYGIRVFRGKRVEWTLLFLETPPPPVEFMIEETSRASLLPEYRLFETHYLSMAIEGEHAFYTLERHRLQHLLEDRDVLDVLRRLKHRAGFVYLLSATVQRSAVRLVRDGFGLLVPFRGRSGIALLRENRPSEAPGAESILDDLRLLREGSAALFRAATRAS